MEDAPWTAEELEQLRHLWLVEKLSGRAIGRLLGRSHNGVYGRVHRLGLPIHGIPPTLANRVRPPPRKVRSDTPLRRTAKPVQPVAAAPRLPAPAAPLTPPGSCEYPLWGILHEDDRPVLSRMRDDVCEPARKCGERATQGAYCDRHHAICYSRSYRVAA